MFNLFGYLQMRGVEKEELMQHFGKIDEINENINKMLDENYELFEELAIIEFLRVKKEVK